MGAAGPDLPGGHPGGRTHTRGAWRRSLTSDTPPPHLCKEVVCFQWYTERQSPQIWHSKEVTCRYANPKGLGRFFRACTGNLVCQIQKGNAELFRVFAELPLPCLNRGCFPPCFQGIGAKRNSYCASLALNYLQVDINK